MTISPRTLFVLSLAVALPLAPTLRAADADDAAGQAYQVLRKYCRQCHAGPADRVKGDLQILDLRALRRRKVVRDGKPDESELFRLVECGSMPPGELPKPGPAEVDVLRQWIAGGAGAFPPEYGDAYVMKQIEKDLAVVNARNPGDMRFQRYVSFNHLRAEDAEPESDLWRAALLHALNHLSREPNSARVTPIDPPANTIFRFDECDLGWQEKPFADSDVDRFDLILLEYPNATLPGRYGGDHRVLADYLRGANPARPILYVRGDWLVSTATQPPLYEDLLGLPRTLPAPDGLEGKFRVGGKAARAAFPDSKMSGAPQLVERRDGDTGGAYWRTFDGGGAKDVRGLVRLPLADRGGLMLFTLPNGLNGYYIAESVPDENGKRLVRLAASAPAAWVSDPNAADRVARNGLSCMRCHERGVEAFADAGAATLADLPAAEKLSLAPLFPGKDALDKFLADDAARFRAAVTAVHQGPLDREPLTPVTRRFLTPAAGGAAGAVVPVADPGGRVPALFPAPDLDAPPLPPLDGLTLPDFQPPLPPVDVRFTSLNFKTGKETNLFAPGDQLALEVKNNGNKEVFIELVGISVDGGMIIHQPPTPLGAGMTYKYPHGRPVKPRDSIAMGLPPGVDRYVLFAADGPFPAGVRLRAPKEANVADRVVHPFWEMSKDGAGFVVRFDPTHLVKKTLFVETH